MYYAHFSSYFAALKFIYFRLTIQSKLIVKRIEMGGGHYKRCINKQIFTFLRHCQSIYYIHT